MQHIESKKYISVKYKFNIKYKSGKYKSGKARESGSDEFRSRQTVDK